MLSLQYQFRFHTILAYILGCSRPRASISRTRGYLPPLLCPVLARLNHPHLPAQILTEGTLLTRRARRSGVAPLICRFVRLQ